MGINVFLKVIGVGAAVGALGAAIWAILIATAGFEFGVLAWIIGICVGGAMRAAAGDQRNAVTGAVAVAIALASVLGGKLFAANHFANPVIELTTEEVVSFIADDVAIEFDQDGKEVRWPRGVNPNEAFIESDYPADVWSEAMIRWDALSAQEQAAYHDECEKYLESEYAGSVMAYFKASFGFLDIVFLGLAAASALKLAGEFD